MIPNDAQEKAAGMLRMYVETEEKLLREIARNLKEIDRRSPSAWAQRKRTELNRMYRSIEVELNTLSKRSARERKELLSEAYDGGIDSFFRETGVKNEHSIRVVTLEALIRDMDGRFSDLHRRILRNAQDVYRDVLAEALPAAVVGTESARQAMQYALNRFADRGITAFVDQAGRRWGMAEYAEMAVRTGMMNASLAGYTEAAVAHGEDLVIITDHADECPLCRPWERRVLSLTGAQRSHPDCTGTVEEARGAGLFHPNCLHAMTVYVPGLTNIAPGNRGEGRQNDNGYLSRQTQRYMERMVRRWKRRQAAALSAEEERYAKAHVDQWQKKLRAAVSRSQLPRKYSREGGRVLLSEAAKKMKPLHANERGAIIQDSRNLKWLRDGYENAVERGDISALTGFEHYCKVAEQLDREMVGLKTSDGIVITGYRTHFIDRIIGSYAINREGVKVSDAIHTLLHPSAIRDTPRSGKAGRLYISSDCKVSLNPETCQLIQTSPGKKEE